MAFELCPVCRQIRGMRISLSERTEKGKKGTKKIQSRTFHCETCHQFVRSEDSAGTHSLYYFLSGSTLLLLTPEESLKTLNVKAAKDVEGNFRAATSRCL
jgi:hypothetical protein